jgi:hemoglobin
VGESFKKAVHVDALLGKSEGMGNLLITINRLLQRKSTHSLTIFRRTRNSGLHQIFEVQDDISRAIANRLKVDLFSLIGGSQTVAAAVEAFYRRILADESISHFFAHSDLAHLRAHLNMFVSALLGGPETYTGRDVAAIHAHLQPRLNDTHFDAFLKHFRAALKEVGVKDDKADRIIKLLERKRSSVLNR